MSPGKMLATIGRRLGRSAARAGNRPRSAASRALVTRWTAPRVTITRGPRKRSCSGTTRRSNSLLPTPGSWICAVKVRPPLARRIAKAGIAALRPQPMTRSGQGGESAASLGCVAAKASLEIFERERVLEALQPKIEQMRRELGGLGKLAAVKEVRQCGFIAGVELRESPRSDKSVAAEVCLGARRHGLLTRPIRNVVVLMPPLCISSAELSRAIEAIRASILEVCGAAPA